MKLAVSGSVHSAVITARASRWPGLTCGFCCAAARRDVRARAHVAGEGGSRPASPNLFAQIPTALGTVRLRVKLETFRRFAAVKREITNTPISAAPKR